MVTSGAPDAKWIREMIMRIQKQKQETEQERQEPVADSNGGSADEAGDNE